MATGPTCISKCDYYETWLGTRHLGPAPRITDVRTTIRDAFDAPREVIGIIMDFIHESASDEIYRVLTSPIGFGLIEERSLRFGRRRKLLRTIMCLPHCVFSSQTVAVLFHADPDIGCGVVRFLSPDEWEEDYEYSPCSGYDCEHCNPTVISRRWKVALSAAVLALGDQDLDDIIAYQRRPYREIQRMEVEQATQLPSVILDLVFSM